MANRFNRTAQAQAQAQDDDNPVIAGYAAVFYDGTPKTEYTLVDDEYGIVVERIAKTAFDNALKRKDDTRGRWNHDSNYLLGRTAAGTLTLTTDNVGLYYEIETDDTPTAANVVGHIRRGDVSGSSFAFHISPGGELWSASKMKDGRLYEVRDLIDLELVNVAPCAYPAYKATDCYLRAESGVIQSASAPTSKFIPTPNLDAARLELLERSWQKDEDDFRFRMARARQNYAMAGAHN